MKKLNYLNKLLNFFYYISFLTILLMIVDYIKILFNHAEILPINLSGVEFTSINTTVKIVLFFSIISAFLFVYAISLLRKVIFYFVNNEIFNQDVILLLNKIGRILIASALTKGIPLLLYKFIFSNNFTETKHIQHFDYHFSGIALGLFFMVLSEVFKIAKGLKEENELTV
jgi:hypothetical protein